MNLENNVVVNNCSLSAVVMQITFSKSVKTY